MTLLSLMWSCSDNSESNGPSRTDGSGYQRTSVAQRCDGRESGPRELADVDGDGRPDQIYLVGAEPAPGQGAQVPSWGQQLGVCTAAGNDYEVTAGGGAVFGTIDVEPDGTAEIITGDTNVSLAFVTLHVLRSGRLSEVRIGSDRLILVRGRGALETHQTFEWACVDVEGDEKRELVELEVSWPTPRTGTFQRRVYSLIGTSAKLSTKETGKAPIASSETERNRALDELIGAPVSAPASDRRNCDTA